MKEIKKKFQPIQVVVLAFLMTFGLFAGNILPQLKSAKAAIISTVDNCLVQGGAILPASDTTTCDGKNLTIEGSSSVLTIYGHHTFQNVTISNDGVLTHDAVVAGDNPATSDKKVDLTIANNLTLESGGKIDVSGKGYLGGTASRIPNGRTNGMSCPPFRDGEWVQATASIYAQAGEGPGGGSPFYHCASHNDTTVAAGGGYGGTGGNGYSYHGELVPGGSIYPAPYLGNHSSNEFEFGSGGGGATNKDAGYGAFAAGAAGGGRISIQADTIDFHGYPGNAIKADGVIGHFMHDNSGDAYGGGGAGGTIWLLVNHVNNGSFSPSVSGGDNGASGSVSPSSGVPLANLTARGGSIDQSSKPFSGSPVPGGGAGGRIVIEPPPTIPAPTATLTANPITITAGQSSTLHWTNTNATSAIIDNGVGSVTLNTSGDSVVTPASTTTYTLTATGPGGTATATALVTVTAAPPPTTTATTVVVKVEWPEGLRTEKIELKTFLKN